MVASRKSLQVWALKTRVIEIAVAGRKRSHAAGPHTGFDQLFNADALIPTISCTIWPALHKLQRNVA